MRIHPLDRIKPKSLVDDGEFELGLRVEAVVFQLVGETDPVGAFQEARPIPGRIARSRSSSNSTMRKGGTGGGRGKTRIVGHWVGRRRSVERQESPQA
jgi:hypothetical protein